ncbi:hypothetical protein [Falsiroseomonas sp. CW058]|uniref:hypothetical protein n=1 Tax=Falsiroseomonas sp. CW058 TaxID=3388664 RepID=UPI003D310289
MALSLVIHRPDGTGDGADAMRAAVRDAVWEVADTHWAVTEDAMLVSGDLSPDYLLDHFRRCLARRGFQTTGELLVAAVGPRAAWSGLGGEAEAWLRDALGG